MKDIELFLKEHKLWTNDFDINHIVEMFTSEMNAGLEDCESSLRMIPTYIEAENKFLTNVPVLAIDAGGTNFRAAIVKFNEQGILQISDLINERMPGLDGVISKEVFFQTMAAYLKYHASKADRIGFCFSYPTEIYPNRDGKLLQFCKEVQAPGVIGRFIGKSLLETLDMTDKKIVLLNDTVATLLAGKSSSFVKTYDSYIGFILGTGTNTCYIEKNKNVLKRTELDKTKSQVINIESGNFSKAPRTDLDVLFDNTTSNPGEYTFEKMISGGYFGGLCLSTLRTAAKEGFFSEDATKKLLSLSDLSSEDLNKFISKSFSGRGPLHSCMTEAQDESNAVCIIESLIDRTAKLVAANLAAVVLKSNKGKLEGSPILITIEGTTFYKLHNLQKLFEKYFRDYLSGDKKRYCEFTEVNQSSLVGAALAGLIN